MRRFTGTATAVGRLVAVGFGLAVSLLAVRAAETAVSVLHIGSSDMTKDLSSAKEKGAMESLQSFIKDETGLNNDIVQLKDWRDLATQMSERKLQVGVFQGYEFAWAREKYPALKPLALAVNGSRYPVVYVVAGKDVDAKNLAGLHDKVLCLSKGLPGFVPFYLERETQALDKKKLATFFSKVTSEDNVEDAIDDVVDGTAQVTAVDRPGLERYKSRKPARFARLKEIAVSQPFPPVVVAYWDGGLDDVTLRRFRDGLLASNRKERGQTMLTMFHLSGFDAVPDDFDQLLAKTRKAYPVEEPAK